MKITLDIPTNDYVQATEVRQEVVQAIVNAFLSSHVWRIYHPYRDGIGRSPSRYVEITRTKSHTSYAFRSEADDKQSQYALIRGVEMKAAFDALISAGYHMFRVHEYGTWMGYVCEKKPFLQWSRNELGKEVESFCDFID